MLQTYPGEAQTERSPERDRHSAIGEEPVRRAENSLAWLLMGEVRALLQNDVEEPETVCWLGAVLAELLPLLETIRDSQFESGCFSDLLHASAAGSADRDDRLCGFQKLIDTLDELAIRLQWNLPVEELVPFADARLARWMDRVLSAYGGRRFAG